MKIHYFQRYYEKENVATANTMLLLSRLYAYSPDKFFRLLKSELLAPDCILDSFEPELTFELQAKSEASIPDAVISQNSFKIVVETKIPSCFNEDQLLRHLRSFNNENYKIMLTLASAPMARNIKLSFDSRLQEYNTEQKFPVRHINTTFEILANAIDELLDDRDYEMKNILDDYLDYCCKDGLITDVNANKYMRVQPTGHSLDFDIQNNIYIVRANREFKPHRYLGLYKDKSVKAIGKVNACITAVMTENGVDYSDNANLDNLTDERRAMIAHFFEENHLINDKHRFYFVDKFYNTEFRKTSKGGLQSSKIFDLTEVLKEVLKKDVNINDIPEPEKLAELLRDKTWS